MNDPKLMTGPQDLWHLAGFEWSNGKYDKPIFIRSAYRRVLHSDGFETLRDRVADKLDDFHPLDFKPIRIAYRACKHLDSILFGEQHNRETTLALGVSLAVIVVALVLRIVTR